jgi:uncharacterized protein (TIGR03067 family)
MRKIVFAATMVFAICATAKQSTGIMDKLDGTWVPVKQEIGGQQLPAAALQNQKLTLRDSTYTMEAESVDKGVVRKNGNKMDIYGREGVNAGKHFTAIYKMENGQLTICYNLMGTSYPESYDTKGKQGFFMSVFKKQ